MKLSAIIIAKNAKELLKDCIASVKFCDEVIVVDGGSTDNTTGLAKHLGARVVIGSNTDFAKQRNIGRDSAKGEWLLYIDTDERVSEELEKNIKAVILSESEESSMKEDPSAMPQDDNKDYYAAFRIKRQNFYLGNHPWPNIEKLERLFRKKDLVTWFGVLHETAKVNGETSELEGFLLHYTHRDLSSMLAKTIQWSGTEASLRYNAHHPKIVTWRLVRVMATGFIDSYIKQGGWKAGTMGLIESMYQSYSMFVTYARLWEMQETTKK